MARYKSKRDMIVTVHENDGDRRRLDLDDIETPIIPIAAQPGPLDEKETEPDL